jgi:pyrroline-5-carboxylate reductase
MRIAFLGAGKMAEAILAALLRRRLCRADAILACDVSAGRRRHLRRRYRVRVTADAAVAAGAADVLVLAVKPQDLDALLAAARPHLTPRHVLLSIAAGKTLARLRRLSGHRRIVRVMPNLAVTVGEGMSAFCAAPGCRPADRRLAQRVFGGCGRAVELPERHFDAITALSGSGPAFCAWLLAALADASAAEGLPAGCTRLLAAQTMLGAARVLLETGRAPADFIAAVASPGGTTAAGLAVLEASDVRAVLAGTIRAAARRSRELCAR